MKERPILFSAPMVRAILRGENPKRQTRRVVKPVGNDEGFVIIDYGNGGWPYRSDDGDSTTHTVKRGGKLYHDETPHACPYGQTGDRLWVRETWGVGSRPDPWGGYDGIEYRADLAWLEEGDDLHCHKVTTPDDVCLGDYHSGWKPSIHMPRWASRISLEITGVRVERLADISEADAAAEGIYNDNDPIPFNGPWFVEPHDVQGYQTASDCYRALWESINGPGSWMGNPWVWVIEFKRVT